jgi:hypothetical protein
LVLEEGLDDQEMDNVYMRESMDHKERHEL